MLILLPGTEPSKISPTIKNHLQNNFFFILQSFLFPSSFLTSFDLSFTTIVVGVFHASHIYVMFVILLPSIWSWPCPGFLRARFLSLSLTAKPSLIFVFWASTLELRVIATMWFSLCLVTFENRQQIKVLSL